VRLDDALLQADRAQAAAAVSVARANLARLRAGATPEELAAAEAAVNEANAALKGVQGAAGSAWAAAGNPQSIDVQIAAADTQANLALRQIDLAKVQLEEARIKLGWLQSISGDDRDENAIEFQQYEVQILEANVRAAEAQYLGAQQKLDLLNEQRGRPLSALAQAHAAQSRVSIAQAQIELAEAKFDLVKNGALPEEIRIAEAQVAAAQSQVDLIAAKIAQLTLIAPIDGIVATRSIQVGETAAQNVPLLTISDLSALKLVVYIPDPQIGLVHLGAPVSISVDSEPGKTFEGVVTLISRQAEFTPRNVQTEEDRVSLVFAVEIAIDNTNGVLKPGMPADATITVPRP
jgi:multidrug resistance efflux pump